MPAWRRSTIKPRSLSFALTDWVKKIKEAQTAAEEEIVHFRATEEAKFNREFSEVSFMSFKHIQRNLRYSLMPHAAWTIVLRFTIVLLSQKFGNGRRNEDLEEKTKVDMEAIKEHYKRNREAAIALMVSHVVKVDTSLSVQELRRIKQLLGPVQA